MTHQEIFNKVIRHLRAQGHQAKGCNTCVYKAGDGSQCAIGCLIPPDKYDPNMEFSRISANVRVANVLKAEGYHIEVDSGEIHGADYRLLLDLQLLHDYRDNWTDKGIFPAAVRDVARKHGLRVPRE